VISFQYIAMTVSPLAFEAPHDSVAAPDPG